MGNCSAKPEGRQVSRDHKNAPRSAFKKKDVPLLVVSTSGSGKVDSSKHQTDENEKGASIEAKRGILKILSGSVTIERYTDTYFEMNNSPNCSFDDYTKVIKQILEEFINTSLITIEHYDNDMRELFRGACSSKQETVSILKLTSLIKKTLVRISERGVAKPPAHQTPGMSELQTNLSVVKQYCAQEEILSDIIKEHVSDNCQVKDLDMAVYYIIRSMGISGSFGDTFLDSQRFLEKQANWSIQRYVFEIFRKSVTRRRSIHPIQLTNKQVVTSLLYELVQIPSWCDNVSSLKKLEQLIDCSLAEVSLFVAMQNRYATMTFEYLVVKELLPMYQRQCQIEIATETETDDPLESLVITNMIDNKTTVVVAFSGPRDTAESEDPVLKLVELESVESEEAIPEQPNPLLRRVKIVSFMSAPLALEWLCFRIVKSLDSFGSGVLSLGDVQRSAFVVFQSAVGVNLMGFHDSWIRFHSKNGSKVTLETFTANCYLFIEDVLDNVSVKTIRHASKNGGIVTNFLRGVKGSPSRLSHLISRRVLIRRVIREQINCTVGAYSSCDTQPKAVGLKPPPNVDLSLFTCTVSLLFKRCGIYQPEDLYHYYEVLYRSTSVNGKLPHLMLEDLVCSVLRVVLFKLENTGNVNYGSWGSNKLVSITSPDDDRVGISNILSAAKSGHLETISRGIGLGVSTSSSFSRVVQMQRSISISSASSFSSACSGSSRLAPRRCSLLPMMEVLPKYSHCGIIHPSPSDFNTALYYICLITGFPCMHLAYMTPSHSLSSLKPSVTFKTVLKVALGASPSESDSNEHDNDNPVDENRERLEQFLSIPGSVETVYQTISQSAGGDMSSCCSTPHILGNSSGGSNRSDPKWNNRSELLLILIQILTFIGFSHEQYSGMLMKYFMGGHEGHPDDVQILKSALATLATEVGVSNVSSLQAFKPVNSFQCAADRLDALNRLPSTADEIVKSIPQFVSNASLEWHQIPFLFRSLFSPVSLNLILYESDLNDFFYDETRGAGIMKMDDAVEWVIKKIDVLKFMIQSE